MTMQAVRVHAYGGPEVLTVETLPKPAAGPGEVLIRVTAAAVTFFDLLNRRGDLAKRAHYKGDSELPLSPGYQGAGIVEAVGDGVEGLAPGVRVAWSWGGTGAYASHVVIPAGQAIVVPDGIGLETAAGSLVQGWLAHALTHIAYPVREGDWCVVQSAAGGVGSLISQFARMRGGRVIGITSNEAKAEVAWETADEVVVSGTSDVAAEVKRITGGKGARVVYDAVGKDAFETNLDCLAPLGFLVNFGQASGYIDPIDPMSLIPKGSPFVTRFNLGAIYSGFPDWEFVEKFFGWIQEGRISVRIDRTYALADAPKAHAAVEQRESAGRVLLCPDAAR